MSDPGSPKENDEVFKALALSLALEMDRTVLLVEDEDPLRRVMKDLLERDGFVVAEARDGAEALAQVDRVGPVGVDRGGPGEVVGVTGGDVAGPLVRRVEVGRLGQRLALLVVGLVEGEEHEPTKLPVASSSLS